jgi:uncharacterized protein (TIGR03643 family)
MGAKFHNQNCRLADEMMKTACDALQISTVIRLAWADRVSFEEIEKRTGFREREVIEVMRRELKTSSFRLWRKRVHGRVTKHRRLLEEHLKGGRGSDFLS